MVTLIDTKNLKEAEELLEIVKGLDEEKKKDFKQFLAGLLFGLQLNKETA